MDDLLLLLNSKVFIAPKGWSTEKPNPFISGGSYDSNWSALCINSEIKSQYTIGKQGAGVFTLNVNPSFKGWQFRLIDFIQYETHYGRKVILSIPDEYDLTSILSNNAKSFFKESNIRQFDERWVVHSTTFQWWEQIVKSGHLKSSSRLKKEGIDIIGIGLEPLGEPEDYADYVMFDTLFGCSEIVVNSRQKGRVCLDANEPYSPGMRMYFDAYAIIKDGLGVRDGAHVIKVYDNLPLEPYLRLTLNEENVPYINQNKFWTPTLFTVASNAVFLETVSKD